MKRRVVFAVGLALVALPHALHAADYAQTLEQAWQAEQDGDDRAAFLGYLSVPHAEHAAIRVARPKAKDFAELLSHHAQDTFLPRYAILNGELHLAQGRRDEALKNYRQVLDFLLQCDAKLAANTDLPEYAYIVEPPAERESGFGIPGNQQALPFTYGCGSHRDNWLLRRFIALEAWDDAAKEFARVWELQRRHTRPYAVIHHPTSTAPPATALDLGANRVLLHSVQPGTPAPNTWYLVTPPGFDGQGLQFALDYAYFLKRLKQTDQAQAILQEAFLRVDLDRNPNEWHLGVAIDEAEAKKHPQRTGGGLFYQSTWGSAGVSRKEFLRLAYGEFKAAGRGAALEEALSNRIKAGDHPAWRTLARIRSFEGKLDDALQLELQYLNRGHLDALTVLYREGLVYEEYQKLAEAAAKYEEALTLAQRFVHFQRNWASTQKLLENLPGVDRDGRVAAELQGYREYEAAQKLGYIPPLLPDKDEERLENQMYTALRQIDLDVAPDAGYVRIRMEILDRLKRLYGALGQPRKVAALALSPFEIEPRRMESLAMLEEALRQYRLGVPEADIRPWLLERAREPEERVGESTNLFARANLLWLADEKEQSFQTLLEGVRDGKGSFQYGEWLNRLKASDRTKARTLLLEVIEAAPKDESARLELILLDGGKVPAVDEIARLENLLKLDAQHFQNFRYSGHGQAELPSAHETAYRLIRLYEKAGDREEKLVALGFRILEGQPPFARKEDALRNYRANWNDSLYSENDGAQGTLLCLYAWLPHLKKPEDQTRCIQLAEKTGCLQLINQAHRLQPDANATRLDPSEQIRAPHGAVTVRTLGLPEGTRLLSHRDDVRAIAPFGKWDGTPGAPDEQWIGTAWGAVRYRRTPAAGDRPANLEILQIPMGGRVNCFCQTPAGLFVGTSNGLFRIDDPSGAEPKAARIGLEAARNEKRFQTTTHQDGHETTEDRWVRSVSVEQLVWWKDALWVHEGTTVYRYTPADNAASEMRGFGDELFVKDDRLFMPSGFYDPTMGEFTEFVRADPRWELIGSTKQEIWADVSVNMELRNRPGLFDPATHRVRPLALSNTARTRNLLIESEIRILAEDEGHVWLISRGEHLMVYQRATGTLSLFTPRRSTAPAGPEVWWTNDSSGTDLQRISLGNGSRSSCGIELKGDRGPRYTWRPLPEGRTLMGASIVREWREDNFGVDDSGGMSHHIQDLEGGLFLVEDRTRTWQKLGSRQEELSDCYVKRIVEDREAGRVYLCTNGGVTILSLDRLEPTGRITVSDGLPSNKVEDVARIGEKLYFACELGDDGGGLAVQDLRTGLIQTLTLADGLVCEKIKRLRAEGEMLHIGYGTVYSVRTRKAVVDQSIPAPGAGQDDVRTLRGSKLDTRSGRWERTEEVLPAMAPDISTRLPFIGGELLCEAKIENKAGAFHLYGGSHGLLISKEALKTRAEDPQIGTEVRRQPTIRQALEEKAGRLAVAARTAEEFAGWMKHENPFVRLQAVRSAQGYLKHRPWAEWGESATKAVRDPFAEVRLAALQWLIEMDIPETRPLLEAALNDPHPNARCLAAAGTIKHGAKIAPDVLCELLPYDLRQSNALFRVLPSHADKEVFAILLERYPVYTENTREALTQLGASLREHPDAVPVLLSAKQTPTAWTSQVEFARLVFKYAGKQMLPVLHEALKSPNRVVRSNAARACGSIGDPSSVQPLVQAIDLESGLARASIVWALGELKAVEAFSALATLYVDAMNDEQRRAGSGFRAAQNKAQEDAQYTKLGRLDELASDWNELKSAAAPALEDPRRNEELLTPAQILQAVAMIGPASAQEFYRKLAGSTDHAAQYEAARRLAEGGPEDREKNLPILRHLLENSDQQIQIRTAVSLYLLGEDATQARIREALKSDQWARTAVQELTRVAEGQRLKPFSQELSALLTRPRVDSYLKQTATELLKRMER